MSGRIRSMLCAVLALLIAPQGSVLAQSADGGTQVAVPGGSVQGSRDVKALVFRGIPFAAPPTADLRWRAPQPVVAWTGMRDAVKPRPACLQHLENGGWNRGNFVFASEDCLTLDVRTPALGGKVPVMLWIHGGSNRAGSADGPAVSNMSDQGVVLVSIQYRLGILGFLSHRALAAEQGGSSGNYGLMDQVAAIKWVKANIARFGGDPDKITLFGESAGSQDVSLMMAAPAATGLFRGAILESGTPGFGMGDRTLEQALVLGDQVDTELKTGGDIAKLRAASPLALFAAEAKIDDPAAMGNSFIWLRTTIDGLVFTKPLREHLADAPKRPVIIGTNKIEFGPGPGGAELEGFSRFWFSDKAAAALAFYRAEEAKGPDPRRGNLELRMQSDAQFHCPANRLADQLVAQGWPVWRYEFDVGPDGAKTSHAQEIGYVMNRWPVGAGVQMQDYWAALGKAGDPNGAGRPVWKRYDRKARATALFDARGLTMAPAPRAAACGFADTL